MNWNGIKFIFKIRYYLQVIASTYGGSISIQVNTKMFNSTLNGPTSSMVKTEVQKMTVSSLPIPETTVFIFY
jgi:hypothetical protein